ncbi:SprA-related family protein [Malonomonas rubra DSM 5091]|uniref:SprA-related family protein n=1 Tax=Malonomonas rubra DSM 5091 TaxID=1122189 RepID=A0A1M6DN78_MALRU|nr:putative metalloprotease CJM1_0395 family protein [Malonomonas rubra]SHI74650.1 SprA-related family protein [Malonomonas rubra DSM 5091]
MLDGINPQAIAYPAQQSQNQAEQSETVTPNSEHEEKVTEVQQVRTMPGQEEVGSDGRKKDSFELSREAQEIRDLQRRDAEVRAHEAAHVAAGGAYAGAANFSYERGPDGQTYAVGGEVSIDMSAIPGDPEATLQKAQQVRAAALAPAEPSSQDMKVAQRAQAMAAEARIEIANQRSEDLSSVAEGMEKNSSSDDASGPEETVSDRSENSQQAPSPSQNNITSGFTRLTTYV